MSGDALSSGKRHVVVGCTDCMPDQEEEECQPCINAHLDTLSFSSTARKDLHPGSRAVFLLSLLRPVRIGRLACIAKEMADMSLCKKALPCPEGESYPGARSSIWLANQCILSEAQQPGSEATQSMQLLQPFWPRIGEAPVLNDDRCE